MTNFSGSDGTILQKKPFIPYVTPFIVFSLFIYFETLFSISRAVLYPIKTITVAFLLFFFWKHFKKEITLSIDVSSILAGMLAFIIWIGLEGHYPQIGTAKTINPFTSFEGFVLYQFIGFRLLGTVCVVPVMEELFWRSFALRFLIDSKFKNIPIGTFSWFSFIFTSFAFGFEHHRWLPGIISGLIYSILLYQKKNLFSPIIAHAVTNFLLGVYVLSTGEWSYW